MDIERSEVPESRRIAVPLGILLWIVVPVLGIVIGDGCGADCHDETPLAMDLRGLALLLGLAVMLLGPIVIALLAFWSGSARTGYAFLAVAVVVGALLLSSDLYIDLLRASLP
ncbi:hypothetical protein [Glycomyces sp. NPDC047010]|uniref:hypothetical protein n=1 Tax=Glycomyces sp. NPDC047010 TaxID=3155023 RepID=UPI0033F55650